jgi:tetratricopeptide (TPR) repeat protein
MMVASERKKHTLAELNQRARSCMEKGDLQGALGFVAQALESLDDKDHKNRAKMLSNQGFLQAGVKKFTDALGSFCKASEFFKSVNDPVGMAIQIGNMGSVYRDQELPDSALEYYQESLDILQKHNFNLGIADQHSNIAYAYSQKGELTSALTHFQEAEKLYEELGEKEKAALCTENIKALKVNL